MQTRQATGQDVQTVAALALRLWPGHAPAALAEEMARYTGGTESAVFLAEAEGCAVGFAQCGLRHDYVEGTDSSPVGYLEGIYVAEDFRRRGVAAALAKACEAWAARRGCSEFASDCEMENAGSIAFHRGVGFAEAGRIVCFVKPLGNHKGEEEV